MHIMNDPQVYAWLGRPVIPYLLGDAKNPAEAFKVASEKTLKVLQHASGQQLPVVVDDCPVKSIREIQADETKIYLGNIGFKRCNWWEFKGVQRDLLMQENQARPTSDPNIVWQVSGFLASSHHRRGIMTVVLATVLNKSAVPRMRRQHMHISVFTGNNGSVRVFEKNGCKLVETIEAAWRYVGIAHHGLGGGVVLYAN
ncbi:hypothetical protein B0H10DRAFT_2047516 [Mycena sp. CBHHK59/15]|nr:hypothetical protein B0H10DRAFT_2047516 [Mycena sp. CBHHK59/15]